MRGKLGLQLEVERVAGFLDRRTEKGQTTADDAALPGLASTVSGYTLAPLQPTLPAGDAVRFAFRITGPDGMPESGGMDVSIDREPAL